MLTVARVGVVAHDLAGGVDPVGRCAEDGVGVVQGGVGPATEQEAVDAVAGILVLAHDLAGRVDAEATFKLVARDVERAEGPAAVQEAVDLAAGHVLADDLTGVVDAEGTEGARGGSGTSRVVNTYSPATPGVARISKERIDVANRFIPGLPIERLTIVNAARASRPKQFIDVQEKVQGFLSCLSKRTVLPAAPADGPEAARSATRSDSRAVPDCAVSGPTLGP